MHLVIVKINIKILEYKNNLIKSYIFHHFYKPVFTAITFSKFKERLCFKNLKSNELLIGKPLVTKN